MMGGMHPDNPINIPLVEALHTLVSELPKPVQEFVLGAEHDRVALELSKKYGLHVDQAGVFERSFMHMLLGISSPQEFVDNLTQAGLPEQTVRGLTQDINELVFIPLRKAEQHLPAPKAQPAVSPQQSPEPQVLPGSTVPVPSVAPPPAWQPYPYFVQPTAYYPTMPPAAPGGYGAQNMPAYVPQPVFAWTPPPAWQQPLQQPVQPVTPEPSSRAVIPAAPAAPKPIPKATLNMSEPLQKSYVADPYREPPEI